MALSDDVRQTHEHFVCPRPKCPLRAAVPCHVQAVPTYIATIAARYDILRAIESGEANAPQFDAGGNEDEPTPSLYTQLSSTLRLLATSDRLALMVPLFMYIGVEQAFFFSVFGSRLVAPTFGDAMVRSLLCFHSRLRFPSLTSHSLRIFGLILLVF
jgi:hypothetical protein